MIKKGDEHAIYNPMFVSPTKEYKNPTFDPELVATEMRKVDNPLYSTLPGSDDNSLYCTPIDGIAISNVGPHYDMLDPKTLSTSPTTVASSAYDSLTINKEYENFNPYESIELDEDDEDDADTSNAAQEPIYELVEMPPNNERINSFSSIGLENPLYGKEND